MKDAKSKWRRAAFVVSLLWAATMLGAVLTFAAQTLLARRLGPAQYGLFASSLATVSMIAPLAGFGLSQFRLRIYGSEGWSADRWLRPSIRFSMFTAMLAMALILAWAFFLAPPDATRSALLILAPVVAGLLAIDLISCKLRLEERHSQLALWQLIMPAGRFCIAIALMLIYMPNAILAAIGYGLVAVLVVVLSFQQVLAMMRGKMDLVGHGPRPTRMLDSVEEAIPGVWTLWSQSWPYGVAAVLYSVFFQISTILLKYLQNDTQAGYYGIALAVMTAIYLLPATIYQKFLLSKLHRWVEHEQETFRRVYRLGNIWMLVLGLIVGLGLALSAPLVVPLAFGDDYEGVVAILWVLALCVPIRFLSTAVGSALLTGDQMRYRVWAMLAATMAAVALNLVLIPHLSGIGAALATVAAEVVLLLAMYRGVRRISVIRTCASDGDQTG